MTRVVKAHTDVIGAIGIALIVVTLYSVWGAYMLGGSDSPAQVAASERQH